MYRSLERSTQDTQDEFFGRVPRPHFFGRSLIWPGYFREHILGLFGLHPSSLSKSAGFVLLSGKASLVSISDAILLLRSWHVYFLLDFEFRGKSCVEWEHGGEDGISSPTLYIIIAYRVNLNKLSRSFVGVIRTTTTNCRVCFIDFYLVFPTNFWIVFLPHTNTVILLEPHCGTITETGWPVGWYGRWTTAGRFETWAIWMLAPLNRASQTVGTRTHLRWPISLIGSVDKTKFYERILARTSFKADYVFRVVHRNIQVNHTYRVTSKD